MEKKNENTKHQGFRTKIPVLKNLELYAKTFHDGNKSAVVNHILEL